MLQYPLDLLSCFNLINEQVVWSETDKVGCGATSYKDGQWYATLYTCNYGPNGNFIRGQMYKQGAPCSDCNNGESCSNQYPGLCGKKLILSILTLFPSSGHQFGNPLPFSLTMRQRHGFCSESE